MKIFQRLGAIGVFSVLMGYGSATEVPDPELLRPKAVDIPESQLVDASSYAARNGILALFERMYAEGNEKNFILPPISQRTVIDRIEVEVRYKKVTRTRNVYKDEYVEQERLVPVKDEYGDITGYEKKKVRVLAKRTIVGQEEYERLVRDPEGDIVRTEKRAVYGKGGPDLIPRGWFAVNAMGLNALNQAGFGKRRDVELLAINLMWLCDRVGLPDSTYDLSWLVIAYAQMPQDSYGAFTTRIIKKLLDAQMPGRKGKGGGLWGPVAINFDVLARFFFIELEINKKLKEIEDVLNGDNERRKQQAQAASNTLTTIQTEVQKALLDVSTQGKRLSEVTKDYLVDEDYELAGLDYYIYNTIVSDLGSTSVAQLALQTAKEADLLPSTISREKPGGYTLVKPSKTAGILNDAIESIIEEAGNNGSFTSAAYIQINKAFDKLTVSGVPYPDKKITPLWQWETLRTNLEGTAALTYALLLNPQGIQKHRGKWEKSQQRSAQGLMNLLQRPAKEKLYTRGLWHGKKGEHLIDGQDIIDARGPIEGEDLKPLAIDDVPFGLISNAELTELIESAAALHKPLVEGEDQRNQLLARLLTYRLVIDQQESGLWGEERMRPFGLTSGSFAVNHQNQQKSMFNRAKKDMQNKGRLMPSVIVSI